MSTSEVKAASRNAGLQIWNAVKLMLPRVGEEAVLRDLLGYVSDRLVLGPENVPQYSGGSRYSPSEEPVSGASSDARQRSQNVHIAPSRLEGSNVILPRAPLAENIQNHGSKPPTAAKQRKRPTTPRRRQRASTWTVSSKSHRPSDSPIFTGGIHGRPIPRTPNNRHTCPLCPQTLSHRVAMEVHAKYHGSAGRNRCSHCDYATDSKHSFNWHVKAHVQPMDGGDVVVDSAVDNRLDLPSD